MEDVNRELRIAPVMTGGTSLAVWMGGVTFELYRMVRSVDGDPAPSTGSAHARTASAAGRAIYRKLLDLTETQPIVDVITGTSAGGLNGSLLAAATHLGVDTNQFSSTRDTWLELANIEALLRKPSEASPPSLLKGDDYFAPQVAAVLRRWDKRAKAPELRAEVDLVTTVTTITPEPDSRSDHFGEQLNEATHAHRLWFRAEHFGDDDWIDKLAIASRTSACIPGVFEPSYLPVGPEDADASGRPDFKPHATFATSRWAVDGGVVVNLPLTEALERIFHRPAVGEVRRVVLYVSPTPSAVEDSKADAAAAEPTVLDAALTFVVAPRAEGVATDVDRLNRHNDQIRRQRQSRRAAIRLLGQLDLCEEPDDEFTRGLLAAYAEVRASTSVASTIERLDAATSKRFAHRRLELEGELEPARRALVADGWAFSKATETWSWGIQPVEQSVSHALSLLNRALVLPRPDSLDAEACDHCRQVIVDAKNQVHEARKAVERVRCADVKYWNERVRGHAEAHHEGSDDEAANNLEEWASTQYAQWPGESLNREEAFATLADAHERVAQALLDAGASIVQLAVGRTGQPDTEREDRAALRIEAGGLAALATNGGVQGVQRGLLALHVVQAVFGGHVINNELVPASRYLSGNVRSKLEVAQAAAVDDPRWEANAAALAAILPRQLEPGEITAGLGAPWIPPADVEAFCAEVLGAEVEVERVAALGRWSVALRAGRRASVSLSSEWGTARADAVTLLDASLNQRLHTVTDEAEDGRRVRNDAETIAARDKQDALGSRFATWVWEEPGRASRLARRYNELFCSVVLPAHDGSHLSLPGLSESFVPHRHQRDAVARILTDGRALLAHAVGAGKTATMVMAAMELRRLGLAAKPAVVVPNHMLEQFSREWLQLYPTAKVLIADRDRLSRHRRKEFVARCATGDWDAVIFTQAGFGRLPLGADLLAGYLGEELARCREALSQSRSGKSLSVKRLERRIAQLEETYQRLLAVDAKDDGVRFEETGIDYLFVDEAHLFKNRRVDSAIDGIGNSGSQRAQDLDGKLWALRRANGPRVVTFATATPVANSIAELWTMQSFLQPDVLSEVDLAPFDSWAATFGRTVTALELAPDGGSYRMKTRFARFQNIPELLTLYRQVADVRTAEDLDLPVPTLAGGGPETVIVPASPTLSAYVAELAARAERVRSRSVMPSEDNMLKITGDGRRAALDLRLVGERPDLDGGKLAVAADRIAAIHRATAGQCYLDEAGEPHPRPGAVQLVFCDASTPSGGGWNAYDELRCLLGERGVPRDSVRFVHEAGTDEAKAGLFAACRDGRVAVLVGSTDKMGIGTNVQLRAVALHHLDCPWRPSDIEQRDGRIVRQGNQNAEVSILRYATEGSFDIYMWQTVERKAAFINQVATGRAVDRDVDDIGDQALSYAEVKALATGNPLILEKASVDAEVARLGRLRRAHLDDQHRLRLALDAAEQRTGSAGSRIHQLESAIERRQDTRGDHFSMSVGGVPHTKRVDAGDHLRRLVSSLVNDELSRHEGVSVGRLAGFDVHVSVDRRFEEVSLTILDVGTEVRWPTGEWRAVDPSSLVQRLERKIQSLDSALADARGDYAASGQEAERARVRLGAPFGHEDRLRELQRRQREITEQLVPSPEEPSTALPASPPERMAVRLAAAGLPNGPRLRR